MVGACLNHVPCKSRCGQDANIDAPCKNKKKARHDGVARHLTNLFPPINFLITEAPDVHNEYHSDGFQDRKAWTEMTGTFWASTWMTVMVEQSFEAWSCPGKEMLAGTSWKDLLWISVVALPTKRRCLNTTRQRKQVRRLESCTSHRRTASGITSPQCRSGTSNRSRHHFWHERPKKLSPHDSAP